MRISKAILWILVLALPLVALAVVLDRRSRAARKVVETRSAVASRVAAILPTSEWPAEEVDQFRQDLPEESTYDWIVMSAKQSPDAYREWYERGNHRFLLPSDRRLEPAFALELLGQVAASLNKGDYDSADQLLGSVRGAMNLVPFHPRPPVR